MTWFHTFLLNFIKYPTKWLLRTSTIPQNIQTELGIDTNRPTVYLMRTNSVTDLIALETSTQQKGLPSPSTTIAITDQKIPTCLYLEEPESLFSNKAMHTNINKQFTQLFHMHRDNRELDLQIVPVSVFWGRAPGRESRGWSELLADRASPNWLRKLFIVLFLGRDNFVCYSKAVSSKLMATTRGTDEEIAHKLIRLARTHFYRRQQSMTGPTLMDRQQLFNAVLAAPMVKKAIQEEMQAKKLTKQATRQQAIKYVDEIAADYREGVIRLGDRLLTRVWNKIYNGIDVKNAEKVRELAQNGHEIIYVPCHRSHMDYLLLTYVIYHEGLVTPHIAAGINLNFWPVGGIFRRGGAFFIRRTFAGNKLYTAVFKQYLEQLFNKGYSVKFYAEGGRSRTGRLLPAKTGMLAMTLQAVMKGVNRPVSLVPVYIGYEHVMEVNSYLKELRGKNKAKESFFGVFSAIRKLKNYGYGFLNFGEPIQVTQYLDQNQPNWRADVAKLEDKKPSWLTPTVNELGLNILCRINQAAAVSGMGLTSLCLLGAEKRAMSKEELILTMEHFLALLKTAPYSDKSSFPPVSAEKLLENTMKLGKLTQSSDSFGDIISVERNNAIAITYYRNNILHLFAVPSLIATIIISQDGCSKKHVLDTVTMLFPLLKRELFMYQDKKQMQDYVERIIDSLQTLGMIENTGRKLIPAEQRSKNFYSLWILRSIIQETLQRYTLVLSQLALEQTVSRSALERRSRQIAERMATLHGISAPEFYDKNVIATFISALRDNDLVAENNDGLLQYSEASQALHQEILTMISREFSKRLLLIN
ncbi:MAG: glycerol-3-phosphate 1-O-acyltransferase PlsB [Aestuariibacter sp.]